MAWEGIVCVLMAAPLAIPLALLGAWAGYGVRQAGMRSRDRQLSMVLVVALIPALLSKDVITPQPFVERVESTTVFINAPPEKIWPYVCALKDLWAPTETLFRAGIAHPISIELPEPRVGGRRVCHLSTGDMPEIVEVFEPGHRLLFRTLSTPPSMIETSPYGDIQPKHLTGYFECRRGQFELVRLPSGKTKVIGTTWYASRVAPEPYWRLWCDTVVEQVHLRVLNEIKRRAERA